MIAKKKKNCKKVIGELWFPGLTLKKLLNLDLIWNK
jgi:hypothetical protein